jgi:hypothetical protein
VTVRVTIKPDPNFPSRWISGNPRSQRKQRYGYRQPAQHKVLVDGAEAGYLYWHRGAWTVQLFGHFGSETFSDGMVGGVRVTGYHQAVAYARRVAPKVKEVQSGA